MKKLLVYLMLTGVLATFASADFPRTTEPSPVLPGEVMTVKVDSLPPGTETAALSFGGTAVHGLLMMKQPDGSWEGHFAVLPSMAGEVLTPAVTARMKDATEQIINLAPRRVKAVGRVKDGDGFITATQNGSVLFVFDHTIRLNTVKVVTTEGALHTASYENNYFRLPAEIALEDVLSVSAESIYGETLELDPTASYQASR